MKFTARYAHMDSPPGLKVGRIVNRGDVVGRMGNSGQSTAAHVHFDLTAGENAGLYSLTDIEAGNPAPGPLRQFMHFLDVEMFGVPLVVTTPYAELEYFQSLGKIHHGFDVVPIDRRVSNAHFDIHWNRSMPGTVIRVANDFHGYGYHICIAYEVPE
jgi:hypothetical protein